MQLFLDENIIFPETLATVYIIYNRSYNRCQVRKRASSLQDQPGIPAE